MLKRKKKISNNKANKISNKISNKKANKKANKIIKTTKKLKIRMITKTKH